MKKAIFFDLQGTLGGHGLGDITNFEFYPFAAEAIKLTNDSGYLAIVVTNQSNINRGKLTMNDFKDKMQKLQLILKKSGAKFDDVFCCPHTHEDNCTCKKPKTGLIKLAAKKYDIDISKSYVIGDMGMNDIVMGKDAGSKAILVLTGVGKDSLKEYRDPWKDYDPDYIAKDVLEAVKYAVSYK